MSRAAAAGRDARATGRSSARRQPTAARAAAPAGIGPERVASWVIIALLWLTPLLVLAHAKESFRLPQGLAGGWLGLTSLLVLAWLLPASGKTPLATLWRQPGVRALLPLLLVVSAGAFSTTHPAHFRAAFADFAMGAVCVAGWSLALRAATLRHLLAWTLPPALVVTALGLDQAAGLFGTLDWMQLSAATDRLRLTSTVGNPGDLAAFLVLPILLAANRWRTADRRMRWALGVALLLMLAMIGLTATFAAIGAVVAGAGVWLSLSVLRGRGLWRPAAGVLALIVLALAAVAIVAPLRARTMEKAAQLARGDINGLLTGRLDGWRVAVDMLRQHPVSGVGQGAFRTEFAETRLSLADRGVTFYPDQIQVILSTPHNEALSVAAEQGLPGLVALAWALWCVYVSARRVGSGADAADDAAIDARALAWAGVAALGVLATFSFPLHVPAIAWPWLLFLAWLFRAAAEADAAPSRAQLTSQDRAADADVTLAPASAPAGGSGLSGRQLFPFIFVGLIAAVGWQTLRASDRITSSRLLGQVEARTLAAIQLRRAPSTLFTQHLAWLDTAGRLDPLEIGIPMARGSQFLLLRRPDEALAAYREAAALEPRPEIDLNIGRALWMRGSKEEARVAFARAVKLNPVLIGGVPAGLLDQPADQPAAQPAQQPTVPRP